MASPQRLGVQGMGTAAQGGPRFLLWALVPSYLPQPWAGALGCSPMTLGRHSLEYSWPARGVQGSTWQPPGQGCLAGLGLEGSLRSGARNAGRQTRQTHSHHSPRAGWGLSGAALSPGPGFLRALPGAARDWHCWRWTCRSFPVGKGGCGRQPLPPGSALPR